MRVGGHSADTTTPAPACGTTVGMRTLVPSFFLLAIMLGCLGCPPSGGGDAGPGPAADAAPPPLPPAEAAPAPPSPAPSAAPAKK